MKFKCFRIWSLISKKITKFYSDHFAEMMMADITGLSICRGWGRGYRDHGSSQNVSAIFTYDTYTKYTRLLSCLWKSKLDFRRFDVIWSTLFIITCAHLFSKFSLVFLDWKVLFVLTMTLDNNDKITIITFDTFNSILLQEKKTSQQSVKYTRTEAQQGTVLAKQKIQLAYTETVIKFFCQTLEARWRPGCGWNILGFFIFVPERKSVNNFLIPLWPRQRWDCNLPLAFTKYLCTSGLFPVWDND